jgi:hypothetical protein
MVLASLKYQICYTHTRMHRILYCTDNNPELYALNQY